MHALKIPVNVYFIDTLFHNTGYNTTLRNPYLLDLKNTFLKFDCLLIILLLKLVDLIEPPEHRENVYILTLIVWKMNLILYWCLLHDIFRKKN